MRPLIAIGVLFTLLGCDPAAPRIIDVQGPVDTVNPGPYRVTVLTEGRVDYVEAYPSLFAGVPWRLTHDGDGYWTFDLPRYESVDGDLFYIVEACGPGGCDRATFDYNQLAGANTCLVDGECPPGQICDRLRRVCKAPPAVCQDDGDCAQDLFCPTPGDICRFPPEACELDSACGPGRVCQDGRCVPRGDCLVDADCAPGFACDAGQCVPPPPECAEDADCPPDRPLCIGGQCAEDTPQGCRGPQDCPPDAPVCDDRGQCVPGEVQCENNECPAGLVCVDGVCVDFGCQVDGDCEPGLVCVAGDCVPPMGCRADGQCGPDGACDVGTGACVEGPRRRICLPCADGAPCGPGLACSDFSGLAFCLPPCADGGACPAGFFCDGQICQPQEFCGGFECDGDDSCPSGVCQSGTCEAPQVCAGNDDCAADRRCEQGTCRPRQAHCREQFDCAPGTGCLAGRCVPTDPGLACTACEPGGACDAQGLCLQLDPNEPQLFCALACGQGGCPPGQFCAEAGFTGLSICVPQDRCEAPADCAPDDFEPNDAPDEATRVGAAFFASLTACDDADVFRLPEQPSVVELFALQGEVFFRLTDRQARLVDQRAVGAGEGWAVEATPGALLEITRRGAEAAAYELFVASAEPMECDDDLFEPNNDRDDAVRIRFGADIGAVICPDDDGGDWYQIGLRGNEQGQLLVRGDGPGTAFIRLEDNRGRVVLEADLGPGDALPLPAFAGLFLQVAPGDAGLLASYRITLSR